MTKDEHSTLDPLISIDEMAKYPNHGSVVWRGLEVKAYMYQGEGITQLAFNDCSCRMIKFYEVLSHSIPFKRSLLR
jgi:hypothetical protein